MASSAVHIAWTRFQRRQLSMATLVDIECVFLAREQRGGVLGTLLDYIGLARRTFRYLKAARPGVLWLQLPPVPLLWVALWYRRFHRPHLKIVADCHNVMFGSKWSAFPFGLRLLRRCDLVVVHNSEIESQVAKRGIGGDKRFVLEDVPPALAYDGVPQKLPACIADRPKPWILVPGSFGADEPVEEVLAMARMCPQWTVVLTGRIENARRWGHDLSSAPENVVTPGYLETAEFDDLLRCADLVLALTREDGIQLSACNEALGFHKAMVVSDTPLLRRLFSQGAVMVDSSRPEHLRDCIVQGLEQKLALEKAAAQLSTRRQQQWTSRLKEGPSWLNPGT